MHRGFEARHEPFVAIDLLVGDRSDLGGVPQQASACFILAVDDTMAGILNWYREEGIIFKGGSGAGINLSTIKNTQR